MRILYLEDQKKMANFVKRGLEEAGYTVDWVQSKESAESFSANFEYDLMIFDVMLENASGLDVAKNVRNDGYKGPILMLTALSSTKDKVRGLDSGADDYLTKPFEFDELLARVRALLRRSSGANESSLLTIADLEMNLVTREVKRQNQKIDLTLKEFALLEFFIRRVGRPQSRSQIAEAVWDMHFDSESNVIDVTVNMLRKKIDKPFEKKLIQTIIGVGYVLSD